MKIKAKWGFIGNAAKLNADSNQVKAGQTFDADSEYASVLIGKGLVVAVDGSGPDQDKGAKPDKGTRQASGGKDKQAKPEASKAGNPEASKAADAGGSGEASATGVAAAGAPGADAGEA